MAFLNPLEQFDITLFWMFSSTNFAVSNIGLMLMLNLSLLAALTNFGEDKRYGLNSFFKLRGFLNFIYSMMKDTLFLTKYTLLPLFFYTFLFMFVSNLVGMMPYSITMTSHLILTLYLSVSFFIGTNLISIMYHSENFFLLFLPEGIPVVIIPVLILIEYVSYFSKMFSLAIRLFANMMSGHILLKILMGFAWSMLSSGVFGGLISLLPFFIVFLVIGLEFAIAFLQAYVFTVLLIMYLNDALNPH